MLKAINIHLPLDVYLLSSGCFTILTYQLKQTNSSLYLLTYKVIMFLFWVFQ